MNKIPAIAIFDIGKTNKKLVLFNEQYQLVYETSTQLLETKDEDGDPCEDVDQLTLWVRNSFNDILRDERFSIKAVNVSAYGASFVYLDEKDKILLPLYNYLKPYPQGLLDKFYKDYGNENIISKETTSPPLGSLNSGLQIYRIKYEKPEVFEKIKYALHLPQYISYVLSSQENSEITSIGCHTYLWDFSKHDYHSWVYEEQLDEKFPAIKSSDSLAGQTENGIPVGVGLHDSSAALIPYLISFAEPFVLLSTGTWNITLNPFNHNPLTVSELQSDCLCYLSYDGKPVKASRLFAGYEHEDFIKKLALYFNKPIDFYKSILYDPSFLSERNNETSFQDSQLSIQNLKTFKNYERPYHHFISDLILKQVESLKIVLRNTEVKKIFVDGGFSSNNVFMPILAQAFPGFEVCGASVSQASALGAALVVHRHWNTTDLPANLVDFKYYSSAKERDSL